MNISISRYNETLLENNMEENEQPWRELEKQLIMDVIETRNLSLFTGKYLSKAENLLESIFPGNKAILLNSGTSALHIALKAHKIGPGDEVILPSITYPATALAVLHAGGKPVFAEIDPHSFTLDPESCLRLITENTKAIIFVHLFGVPDNIEKVVDLCKLKDIILIEDCAQAFGSTLKGKQAGTFGQAGCFSFFESKTISAGEGGALIIPENTMAALGRRYRHHGMDAINNERSVAVEGYNYKPSEFQSALVCAQLKYYKEIIHKRISTSKFIYSQLGGKFKFQAISDHTDAVLDKICFFFNSKKDRKKAEILDHGFGLFRYLNRPLFKEPLFTSFGPIHEHPVSEFFCKHHLVLQVSPYQQKKDIKKNINNFTKRYRR